MAEQRIPSLEHPCADDTPSGSPTDPASAPERGRGAREPEPLWRHLLGGELRRLRQERGETLGGIARRAGISPQYLSEVERGAKDPSSEMIAAIAGALGVALVDLTRAVTGGLTTEPSATLATVTSLAIVSPSVALAA